MNQIALISLTPRLSFADVAQVGAALNKQIARDFNPIWEKDATVDAFESLDHAPPDYWAVTIEDLGVDVATGIHGDRDLQPFARIAYSNMWALSASHEILEMLQDPFGSLRMAGPHPDDPGVRVEYLVEICDPCQDPQFGYTVNGFLLSDFVTRAYYQPDQSDAIRYSFCGHVKKPRQVLAGGYLAWKDPSQGIWCQLRRSLAGNPTIEPIELADAMRSSLRERVDAASPERPWVRGLPRSHPDLARAARARRGAARAARAAAKTFRSYLLALDASDAGPPDAVGRKPTRRVSSDDGVDASSRPTVAHRARAARGRPPRRRRDG